MSAIRLFLILGLSVGLGACGYSLRGSDVLSSRYPALQLNASQPNSELARMLRRGLEVANVDVSAGIDSTLPTLSLGGETQANRPVSVNPRARAAQYEIRLSVTMALTMGDTELIPLQTLVVERSYFEDIENLAGNQEEVQIILGEMRRDLANQIMRRLEADS